MLGADCFSNCQLSIFSDALFCLFGFLPSGEMYELHADGYPDGEASWQLQRTGAVLLSGRTQILHPLEAITQE